MLQVRENCYGGELPQIIVMFSCSLVGLYEGMLFSWNSPAIPELVRDTTRNITIEESSYFSLISSLGMAVTAPLFPILMDVIGRRLAILLIAIPALIAWILVLLGQNIWIYYVSRFFSGMVDAGMFAIIPVYVCEITEPKVRGTWGNVPSISVYMGIFLINLIGSYNGIFKTAALSISLPIIHIMVFLLMPESPYYLLMNGREDEAKESLKRLRWKDDVDIEFVSLKLDVERQISETGTMRDLIFIKSNRKALLICILIRVAQQFTGLTAFEIYTQYMFQQAKSGLSDKSSSIIYSAVIVVLNSSSTYFIERLGRRPLVIISCFGCGIILSILSIYFYIGEYTTIDLHNSKWVPLVGMSIYALFLTMGMGVLPTLMLGELFSNSIKSKAISVMNIVVALCFLLVPKIYQLLSFNFGIFSPFAVFGLSSIVGAVLCYMYVIETKGKTLEFIQQELKGNKIL